MSESESGAMLRATALVRAALLVIASLGALVGAWLLAADPLTRIHHQVTDGAAWGALPLDLLVEAVAATALAGSAAWASLMVVTTVVVTLVETASGVSVRVAGALAPAVVRRAVVLCCGVALGGSSLAGPASAHPALAEGTGVVAPQHASSTAPPSAPASAGLLTGLRLPDRTLGHLPERRPSTHGTRRGSTGAARTLEVVPAAATTGSVDSGHQHEGPRLHRVRVGESLWGIAAHLLPRARAARVDAAWRAIYRGNHQTIGADPDLLIPGTTLRLPPGIRPERSDRPGEHGLTHHRKDPS